MNPDSPDGSRDDAEPPGRDAALARIERLPGWPELAAALVGYDLRSGPAADEVLILVQGWERLSRFAAAGRIAVAAVLPECAEYQHCTAPRDPDVAHVHRPIEPAGDELSLAMTIGPARAKHDLVRAHELTTELTATLVALRNGRIDEQRAALIADRTRVLSTVELRQQVEAVVLPKARRRTAAQLDRLLRRAVIAADPAAAERRRRLGESERRVERPAPDAVDARDGMARMQLVGPAEDLVALYTAIDAGARHARTAGRGRGDERTLDQWRFDALTGMGWTGLDLGHLGCCALACAGVVGDCVGAANPGAAAVDAGVERSGRSDLPAICMPMATRHGRAATVNMTIAVSSLFGLDDLPGDLDGFGPAMAGAVRRVAGRSTLFRVLTDDAGAPLAYGRTRYRPGPELVEHVAVRDVTCRFPTCAVSARACDVDHRQPWDDGGPTDPGNTWALHQGHHLGKTHHGFSAVVDPGAGSVRWITPAGRSYPVESDLAGLARPQRHRVPPDLDPPPF